MGSGYRDDVQRVNRIWFSDPHHIGFEAVVARLKEPYRTMVLVAQCLGLRMSEITALKWEDLEIEARQLLVQRSVVNGRVDER